jgi:hypothetical protein
MLFFLSNTKKLSKICNIGNNICGVKVSMLVSRAVDIVDCKG